jgi:hypothetical protein
MPLTIVNSIIYYNKSKKFKKTFRGSAILWRQCDKSAITKKEKALNAYVFKAFL